MTTEFNPRSARAVGHATLVSTAVLLSVVANGCAVLGKSASVSLDDGPFAASEAAREDQGRMVSPMTQATMEVLFAGEVDAILGPAGAIQTKVDGFNVYLISDPANDRMRIVVPIALASKLDPRFLRIMLEANFHRTGDARYGTSEDVVYAAFMHPISSLSPALLKSSLAQVLSLAKTFGTRFSSDALDFSPVAAEEAP